MKSIIIPLLLVLGFPAAHASSIIISEILFWPAGTDSGGEFVELYNPTEYPVNISGWVIATESSETDATIPEGTVLEAHRFFLVADANWDENKDNSSWPSADLEETITMSNSDSGVALVAFGDIIDAVGWGDAAGIEEGKYEGVPFQNMTKGWSIERKPGFEDPLGGNGQDSDDNAADFLLRNPEPQNSGSSETPFTYDPKHSGNFSIVFTVEGQGSVFVSVDVEDDLDQEGVQLMPFPGEYREVRVNATVDGTDVPQVSVQFGNATFILTLIETNGSMRYFSGEFSLPFHQDSGNASVRFIIQDETVQEEVMIEIMEVAALSLDSPGMSFEGVGGEEFTTWGDDDVGTEDRPTIRNIGNVVLDFKAKGSTFEGSQELPAEIAGWNLDLSENFMPLSEQWNIIDADLSSGDMMTLPLSVRVSVPSDAEGGYSGSMLIAGVAS
ncbi:MAG: lamin tail domain-containing protein [Nanoarchaeota archaeon]